MSDLIPNIQILIVFQCLFFISFLSVSGRFSSIPNRLLGILLAILAFHMSLNLTNAAMPNPLWSKLGIALGFCYGPTLYLYTRSLTLKDFSLKSRNVWHLLPGLAALALTYFVKLHIFFYAAGIFSSLTVYAYFSQIRLVKYRAVLGHIRSEYDTIALNWLSYLLVIQIGLLALNITSTLLHSSENAIAGQWAEAALFFGLLLMVNFIVYNGLQHPTLFSGITKDEEDLLVTSNAKSALNTPSPKDTLKLFTEIEAHMEKYQPYLNPDLTVKSLGRQLFATPRHISQAINCIAKKNFSEYVNIYRIRYAQDLLSSDAEPQISIMDVMLQSGFNTKSNFNRSFKAVSNMTPISYRERYSRTKKNKI